MHVNKNIIFAMLTFQVLILVSMIGISYYPIMVGKEIRMKVAALDPRDLLRGNYVQLDYHFNNLSLIKPKVQEDSIDMELDPIFFRPYVESHLSEGGDWNALNWVYVELAEKEGFYEPVAVWDRRPEGQKVYLQARVSYINGDYLNLEAGIEDYYTDVKRAKELEQELRDEKHANYAVVYVAPNGVARLEKVETYSE